MSQWLPEAMPEDLETEGVILSTICAAGNETAAQECCAELCAADFVHPAHQVIFRALCAVLDGGKEVSALTLMEQIRAKGEAGRVGNFTGLTEKLMKTEVGRPMVLVGMLQNLRRRRELIKLGARIIREALDNTQNPDGIMETIGNELCRIVSAPVATVAIPEFSPAAMEALRDDFKGVKKTGTYFKSWSRLNGVTQGLKPGTLTVLAARPGVGKSALALNLIRAAAEYYKPALLFTLEMSKEECFNRLLADIAGVNVRSAIQDRDIQAFKRLETAQETLDKIPIWMNDQGSITARQIRAQVDRLIARGVTPGLVVIDYLQLISSPDAGKDRSETLRLADITRALKLLAKDKGISVMVLSQLNREVEKRAGKKPQLSDLRDSGAIEQDADIVLFLHQEAQMEPKDPSDGKPMQLIFAKHRNGPTPTLPLMFYPTLTRYVEVERQTVPYQERELNEWEKVYL